MESSVVGGSTIRSSDPSSSTEPTRNGDGTSRSDGSIKWNSGLAGKPSFVNKKAAGGTDGPPPPTPNSVRTGDSTGMSPMASPRRKVGSHVGQPALPEMVNQWDGDGDADVDEHVGNSGEKAQPFVEEEPLSTVAADNGVAAAATVASAMPDLSLIHI